MGQLGIASAVLLSTLIVQEQMVRAQLVQCRA